MILISSPLKVDALTAIGAQFLRDIKPGEIVTITREGITSNLTLCQSRQAHCIFEYIYFAVWTANWTVSPYMSPDFVPVHRLPKPIPQMLT